MANISSPLPYLAKREFGLLPDIKSSFFTNRLNAAKNLYRKDLVCHFGCVNAIDFSKNGELLVSGGDDRRVMLWQFGKAIMDYGQPVAMKSSHQSNIFCLGMTSDNQKIYSGGNDDMVIVHDTESGSPLEVLQHQRAVCALSVDPFNDHILATAGNDGRLLLFDTRLSVHETMVISRSRRPFHGAMFHPQQLCVIVSANARDGVALHDVRAPKLPLIRYHSTSQNCMSVRFNSTGTHILALRRRQSPVLYAIHSADPVAEFYHQDYYNSCTMKSCSFAGDQDQFVLSGSDDFNLYMWKVPELADMGHAKDKHVIVDSPHIVLYGHRSIVNQVRYNPHYCLIASSGVEKIIKVWSVLEYPQMRGALLKEAQGSDNPREIYSHEDYVSLVHHSGQYITHNYAEQSTREDPRMMAFFDSLVQRELECLAAESDSLDDTSARTTDSDAAPPAARWTKRPAGGVRSHRCPHRLARLVASRHASTARPQKRGPLRRAKPTRSALMKSTSKCPTSTSSKGKRSVTRRPRGSRRPYTGHVRLSAPSSERTDSDDPPRGLFRDARMIRPLRRRLNPTRPVNKRKSKTSYRKAMNLRTNGTTTTDDNSEMFDFPKETGYEDSLAQPSTSTGYRGQSTSALFRIAEVDSDDDQSPGSQPGSPHPSTPNNLVSIVPTPINGSRDTLADSLRAEDHNIDHRSSTPDRRIRRNRRNGRVSISHRSDSSDLDMTKQMGRAGTSTERVPQIGYNRTVARLMNETNESELESSCSTESSLWPADVNTPDSGVGTVAGSSTRNGRPIDDVSDDPEYQAIKFRQRVKKARRNYRNHMDSDSN